MLHSAGLQRTQSFTVFTSHYSWYEGKFKFLVTLMYINSLYNGSHIPLVIFKQNYKEDDVI